MGGKYDELIGGGKLVLDVHEVLNEDSANEVDRELKKQRAKAEKPIEMKVDIDDSAALRKLNKLTDAVRNNRKALKKAISSGSDIGAISGYIRTHEQLEQQIRTVTKEVKNNNKAISSSKRALTDAKNLIDSLSVSLDNVGKKDISKPIKKVAEAAKPKKATRKQKQIAEKQPEKPVEDKAPETGTGAKTTKENVRSTEKQVRTIEQVNAELNAEKKKLEEIKAQQEKNDAAFEKLARKRANYAKEVLGSNKAVYDAGKIRLAESALEAFNAQLYKRNQFVERYAKLTEIISQSFVGQYGIDNGLYGNIDEYIEGNSQMKQLQSLAKNGIKGFPTKDIDKLFSGVVRDLRSSLDMTRSLISSGDVLGVDVIKELDAEEISLGQERQRLYDAHEAQLTRVNDLRQEELDLIVKNGQAEAETAKQAEKAAKTRKKSTLDMVKATKEYNSIMASLGYEHRTVGTGYSEGTDKWNLRDMVSEAQYTLDTYYEGGHANGDMRYGNEEEQRHWREDTEMLKGFINTYKKYVKKLQTTENHVSEWDNTIQVQTTSTEAQTSAVEQSSAALQTETVQLEQNTAAFEKNAKTRKKIAGLIQRYNDLVFDIDGSGDMEISNPNTAGWKISDIIKSLEADLELMKVSDIGAPENAGPKYRKSRIGKLERLINAFKPYAGDDEPAVNYLSVSDAATKATKKQESAVEELGNTAEQTGNKISKTLNKAIQTYNNIMGNIVNSDATIGGTGGVTFESIGGLEGMLKKARDLYDMYYEPGNNYSETRDANNAAWQAETSALRGFLSSYSKHVDNSKEAIYAKVQEKKKEFAKLNLPDYRSIDPTNTEQYLAFKREELVIYEKQLEVATELYELKKQYYSAPSYTPNWNKQLDQDDDKIAISDYATEDYIKDRKGWVESTKKTIQRELDSIVDKEIKAQGLDSYLDGQIVFFRGTSSRHDIEEPAPKLEETIENIPGQISVFDVLEGKVEDATDAVEELSQTTRKYYEINEAVAKQAKQAMSFDDYIDGSATQAYRNSVDEMGKIVDEKKKEFPEHAAELDKLLDRYAKNLAEFINKKNTIDASVPSIMIAGPDAVSASKKERQNQRSDANFKFYQDKVEPIADRIKNYGSGANAIRTDDENALDSLEKKVEDLKKAHQIMVDANKYFRKHKTLDGFEGLSNELKKQVNETRAAWGKPDMQPFPQYALQNSRAEIKRLEARIKEVSGLKANNGLQEDNDFYSLITDKNDMRIRISFKMGKPEQEIIDMLKGKSFKWSKQNNAWQRQLTDNAISATKKLQEALQGRYGIGDKPITSQAWEFSATPNGQITMFEGMSDAIDNAKELGDVLEEVAKIPGQIHMDEVAQDIESAAQSAKKLFAHAGYLGDLENTLPSLPLGNVVPVVNGSGVGGITGLYGISNNPELMTNSNGFAYNEWHGAKISHIDPSFYKLFDATSNELADQLGAFVGELHAKIYGFAIDAFTGDMIDPATIKTVDELYSMLGALVKDMNMDFEEFKKFVEDSQTIVAGAKFKYEEMPSIDKGIAKSNSSYSLEGVPESVFKSDSFATQLLKRLGFEGYDVSGTKYDGTYTGGSVVFNVKPESIVARDENWSDVMKRMGFNVSEQDLTYEKKRQQLALDTAKVYRRSQLDAPTQDKLVDSTKEVESVAESAAESQKKLDDAMTDTNDSANPLVSTLTRLQELYAEERAAYDSGYKQSDALRREANSIVLKHGDRDQAAHIAEQSQKTLDEAVKHLNIANGIAKVFDSLAKGERLDDMKPDLDNYLRERGVPLFHRRGEKLDQEMHVDDVYNKLANGLQEVATTAESAASSEERLAESHREVDATADGAADANAELAETNREVAVSNTGFDEIAAEHAAKKERMASLPGLSEEERGAVFGDNNLEEWLKNAYNLKKEDRTEILEEFYKLAQITKSMFDDNQGADLYHDKIRDISRMIIEKSTIKKDNVGLGQLFDYISGKTIPWTEELAHEFGDGWANAQKALSRYFATSPSEGLSLNSFWEEMVEQAPDAFTSAEKEANNDKDQFVTMVNKLLEMVKVRRNNNYRGFKTDVKRLTEDDFDNTFDSVEVKWADQSSALYDVSHASEELLENERAIEGVLEEQTQERKEGAQVARDTASISDDISEDDGDEKRPSFIDTDIDTALKQLRDAFDNKTNLIDLSSVFTTGDLETQISGMAEKILGDDTKLSLGSVVAQGDVARITLYNKELGVTISQVYKLKKATEDAQEATLQHMPDADVYKHDVKSAKAYSDAQQREADRNDKWLIQQLAKLDKQELSYKYSSKKVDGGKSLINEDAKYAGETIEGLAKSIRERANNAMGGVLTEAVKNEITDSLRVLDHEIKVAQSEKYKKGVLSAQEVTEAKATNEYKLDAFEAKAKNNNIFTQLEEDIRTMRTELKGVTEQDSSGLDRFVDKFRTAEAKFKAEMTKQQGEKQEERDLQTVLNLQERLYEIKKKQAELEVKGELGTAEGQKISRKATELQKEYEASLALLKNTEDRNAALQRQTQLEKEVGAVRAEQEAKQEAADKKNAEQERAQQIEKYYQSVLETVNRINSIDSKINDLKFKDGGSGIYSDLIEQLESEKTALLGRIDQIGDAINQEFNGVFKSVGDLDQVSFSFDSLLKNTGAYGILLDFFNDTEVRATLATEKIDKFVQAIDKSQNIEFDFKSKINDQFDSVDKLVSKLKEINEALGDSSNLGDNARYQEIMQMFGVFEQLKAYGDENGWTAQGLAFFEQAAAQVSKYSNELIQATEQERKYFANKQKVSGGETYDDYTRPPSAELSVNVDSTTSDAIKTQKQKLEEYIAAYSKGKGIITDFIKTANGVNKIEFSIIDETVGELRTFSVEMGQFSDNIYMTETTMKNLTGGTDAAKRAINELVEAIARLNQMKAGGADVDVDGQIAKLEEKLQALTSKLSSTGDSKDIGSQTAYKNLANDAQKALKDVTKLEQEWAKVQALLDDSNSGVKNLGKINQAGDVYAQMMAKIRAAAGDATISNVKFDKATDTLTYTLIGTNKEVTEMVAKMHQLNGVVTTQQGKVGKLKNWWQDLGVGLGGIGKQIGRYAVNLFQVYDFVRYFRQGFAMVKEIDLALTELKKVTDETEASYRKFLTTASQTAGQIGSTVSDFTTASANFARLGYTMEESADMAKTAIVYKNVADGLDTVEESTESIISTMKAFGIEADDTMSIVDRFNAVGNSFAITSAGIGDALQRSASALYEAGNTIDESVALVTTANSVIQNPEQVGECLPTIKVAI